MKMNKKLPVILLSSALLLALAGAVALSAFLFREKEQSPEAAPSPLPETESSLEVSAESESEAEESLPEDLPTVEVFYYNGLRLGVAEEGVSAAALTEQIRSLLGKDYTLDGELTVAQEQCAASPLSLSLLAEKVAGIVKNDYTAGCGLYINGVLSAVAENQKILEKAVSLFIEKQAKEEGVRMELRGLSYQSDVIVKTADLMSGNEVCALLSLCTDLKMELPSDINYAKVDRFVESETLPHVTPVLVEVKSEEVVEQIPFETLLNEDKTLYEGTKILVSAGSEGSKKLTYTVTYENGVEVSRSLSNILVMVEPINEVYRVGALAKGSATGSLMWPTTEGYISSHYGYRYLFGVTKLHGGTDIAIVTGTKLYAADGGTVICASDKGNGYGIYVIIDHGNGMKTYYAHMSKVQVKVGDKVNKGDLLGLSGATGRVTGPHLHFEVRIDGVQKDPMLYLPKTR